MTQSTAHHAKQPIRFRGPHSPRAIIAPRPTTTTTTTLADTVVVVGEEVLFGRNRDPNACATCPTAHRDDTGSRSCPGLPLSRDVHFIMRFYFAI